MESGLSSRCGCTGNIGYPRNGYVQTSREVIFPAGIVLSGRLCKRSCWSKWAQPRDEGTSRQICAGAAIVASKNAAICAVIENSCRTLGR